MKVTIKLNKKLELDIEPNQKHWNEASKDDRKVYILNEIQENFTLEDFLNIEDFIVEEELFCDKAKSNLKEKNL